VAVARSESARCRVPTAMRRQEEDPLAPLHAEVVACRKCPRLVAWREKVAQEKRAAFRDWTYWGRPVPGFGAPNARLLIVGLAPAAHGANRTGRMFTGDRSGDWLFRALHRQGFATQPDARRRDDGLELVDAYLTATVRCAPPANRPKPSERRSCRPYLVRELDHFFPRLRCVVALGGFAWDQLLRILGDRGVPIPKPRPTFGHGAELPLEEGPLLLASYHPSQQNTFTGRLTEEAFDALWARAREVVEG
jgi:uracil-DNA glycosylase